MVMFGWWVVNYSPIIKKSLVSDQIFVIKKGESLSSIAQRLTEERLIRNALFFKSYVRIRGLTKKVQAGSYKLNQSLDIGQITAIIVKNPVDIWLTFPEGWRKEEIAQRLSANLDDFNKQEFLSLVENLEGKLFPDTYSIPLGINTSAVIEIFSKNFAKRTKDLNFKNEDLILASIVEREVKDNQDRRVVAGILRKRLRQGWPLQADATIQYALGKDSDWWPELSKKDLNINSPYNTYKHQGLPPTPICNPGLDSIKAALEPTETAYWFYISDNQGKIHFAQTNEEHLQNITNYLGI